MFKNADEFLFAANGFRKRLRRHCLRTAFLAALVAGALVAPAPATGRERPDAHGTESGDAPPPAEPPKPPPDVMPTMKEIFAGPFIDIVQMCERWAEKNMLPSGCFEGAGRRLLQKLKEVKEPDPAANPGWAKVRAEAAEVGAFLRSGPKTLTMDAFRDEARKRITALRINASRQEAEEHGRYSLVSRGGISLGSWQAGFLYYLTEVLKLRPGTRPGDPAFTTVAGASAGAVNAFAAAASGCELPNADPEASLFHEIWIDLGLFGRHGAAGLLDEGATTLGAFSPKALDEAMDRVRQHLRKGSRFPAAACEVDAGVAVTHLTEKRVPVFRNSSGKTVVNASQLKEKFILHLSFDRTRDSAESKGNSVLEAKNLRPPELNPGDPFAPEGFNDRQFFPLLGADSNPDTPVPQNLVLSAVRASGAFPGAFPPVDLTYRTVSSSGTVNEVTRAPFIDGGIFDNVPLGLAVALDRWREVPRRYSENFVSQLLPEPPRTYVFVEPEVLSWDLGNDAGLSAPKIRSQDIFSAYLRFAGGVLGSTFDASLISSAERWPFVRTERPDRVYPGIAIPQRNLPITGALLGHLLAFLERDFREFDFYVGMADADSFAQKDPFLRTISKTGTAVASDRAGYFKCMLDYYDGPAALDRRLTVADLPLSCGRLGAAADGNKGLPSGPERERDPQPVPLPKGPRDPAAADARLTDREAALADAVKKIRKTGTAPSDAEQAIAAGNFRALIVAMHNFKRWTMTSSSGAPGGKHYDPGYSPDLEFDRFFIELGQTSFRFVDAAATGSGSDGRLDVDEARDLVRRLLHDGLQRLAEEQPTLWPGVAVEIGGRAAADRYSRLWPRHTFGSGFTLNGIEGYYGYTPANATRLDVGLRVNRIGPKEISRTDSIWLADLNVYSRFAFVIPGDWIDLEAGPGVVVCETGQISPFHHAMTRFGVQGFFDVVGFKRLYAHLDVDWLPISTVSERYDGTAVRIGATWRLTTAFGWRWLLQ